MRKEKMFDVSIFSLLCTGRVFFDYLLPPIAFQCSIAAFQPQVDFAEDVLSSRRRLLIHSPPVCASVSEIRIGIVFTVMSDFFIQSLNRLIKGSNTFAECL
jgi:hypothetical protein